MGDATTFTGKMLAFAPSQREEREERLTMAGDEVPHGPESRMEETHGVTENTESHRHKPARGQEGKRGGEVVKGCQRQPSKLNTESRTRGHQAQSKGRWLEGLGTV